MFKEYRLTIFAVIVFAAIIVFGIKGAAKQNVNIEEPTSYLPLPLKDIAESVKSQADLKDWDKDLFIRR
jgi:hypothetical protein